jgi:NAD(P)-dependent dehydrogenase (short-subunit alcohol dehydrogenase family)
MTVAENLALARGGLKAIVDWPAQVAAMRRFMQTTPFTLPLEGTNVAVEPNELPSLDTSKPVGEVKQDSETMSVAQLQAKAADFQLARNLAHEYGRHGIRVNCIAPGLIKTDFAKALWDNPETLKRSTETVPLRRIGEPDEIAGAAVFLASAAGTFMTGQAVVVDGGATI